MNQIKIIRLVDGEDIVASFDVLSNGNIRVHNPMTLFFKRMTAERSVVLMTPWLPLELMEDDGAEIIESKIMSFIQPKKSLVDYYIKYVEQYSIAIEESANAIDEALKEQLEDAPDEEDIQEELKEALMKFSANLSKDKLH